MPSTTGQVLEKRYRIDALMAQGGMGAVYRATDLRFNVPVAIKENLETSPEAQAQFAREAGLLAGLRHPNLPRVTDYFYIPGHGQYLVMDYVSGEDLDEVLEKQGAMPEAQAVAWIVQVLDALEYLHEGSVVHRDVKPANIKICPDPLKRAGEQLFLVDFGLAKVYDPLMPTTMGARGVTPGYSSPEQYGTGRTDSRSDIYSVGATLYTMLTGQAPPDALEIVTGRAVLEPPRQLRPDISPRVEAAVVRAMETRADDRFQSAAEMQVVLTAPPPTPPGLPPPVSPRPASEAAVPGARSDPAPGHPPALPAATGAAGGITTLKWILTFLAVIAALLGAFWLMWNWPAWPSAGIRPTPAMTAAVQASVPFVPQPATATGQEPGMGLTPRPAAGRPAATQPGGSSRVRPADGAVMIGVPAGDFLMGSTDADQAFAADEMPQHRVWLEGFWIDRTEVTNDQFRKCVDTGACRQLSTCNYGSSTYGDRSKGQQPVVCVSWEEARIYCFWAGGRLPTEAEWEKAARGSDGRIYPWGYDTPDCSRAQFGNCGGDALPAGSKPDGASPYGVLDMAGNVAEWVTDWYGPDFYVSSPAHNPTGPDSGSTRVLRGGGWRDYATSLRAAARYLNDPADRNGTVGFRCVMTEPGQ